jgi:hypothetical protein
MADFKSARKYRVSSKIQCQFVYVKSESTGEAIEFLYQNMPTAQLVEYIAPAFEGSRILDYVL